MVMLLRPWGLASEVFLPAFSPFFLTGTHTRVSWALKFKVTFVIKVVKSPRTQFGGFLNTSLDYSPCRFVSLQPEVAVTSSGCNGSLPISRWLSATPVHFRGGLACRPGVRVVDGHVLIGFAALFGFEIDSQVTVDNRRVPGDVADIPAGDWIDGVDQMVRFVQPVALLLITGQWVRGDPVEIVEIAGMCVLRVSRNTHNKLLVQVLTKLISGACWAW